MTFIVGFLIVAFLGFCAALIQCILRKSTWLSLGVSLVSHTLLGLLVFYTSELKTKGSDAYWRHNAGNSLASIENLLHNPTNVAPVRSLIQSELQGDPTVSLSQMRDLSQKLSALEERAFPIDASKEK